MSAWNATVTMSVISRKCSGKSAGTPYGLSILGSICALSFSAFSICRSISRIDERYSSSLRCRSGPRSALQLLGVVRSRNRGCCGATSPARRALPGLSDSAVAEQPLEQGARIENRRQRLRLASPCEIVRVGAGIARIAVARLTRVFQAEFERRETRLLADLVRDDLIARDAGLDVDQRLLDLYAGEIRSAAAAVIARAVEQRAPGVVGQVADQ